MAKSKRKKVEDKIWSVVREIVYIRDKSICQMCGKYQEKGLHGSHVFGRGAYRDPYIKWEPLNVKLLCYYCHMKWASSPVESGKWFADKFPERLEYLEQLIIDRKFTGTVSLVDLEEMHDKLKQELKEMNP